MRKLSALVRRATGAAGQQTVGIGVIAAGVAQWSTGAALVVVGVVVTALGVSREVKGRADAR